MRFIIGQGLLGRIRFKDGPVPEYDRPYLIVEVSADYIEVLNVSSVKGKERKLAFKTNERLIRYNPPFLKPSFVKLDSITRVDASEWNELQILCNGETLDFDELNRIRKMILR